jgi:hypothetical protein
MRPRSQALSKSSAITMRTDHVTFTIDNSRPTSVGLPRDLRVLKETS